MELGTNEKTRDEKTEATETLTAEIDELEASVAKLAEDVTELSEDIAEIDANIAKATKIRDAENTKNLQTIKEAQDAQAAVDSALDALKDFYGKASGATALVQKKKPSLMQKGTKGL